MPVGRGGSGVIGAAIVARGGEPGDASHRRPGGRRGRPSISSWKAGNGIVTDEVSTFAEGLATREPFDLPLQLLPGLVDEIMLVSDAELGAAIRLLLETTGQLAEGAGRVPRSPGTHWADVVS